MVKKYRAVIVGAGSIGATKPDKFDGPKTKNVLTLAHAFHAHPRTKLIGIVDTDLAKAQRAALKWNTKGFQSVYGIGSPIDVMAVCVPTKEHRAFVWEHFGLDEGSLLPSFMHPKVILMEKPFGENLEDSQVIKATLDMRRIPVAVDYSRRFDKTYEIIRERIDQGKAGEVYSCVVHYDRGLLRDGSHAIDLCNYLFGEFKGGDILPGRRVHDYDDKDITYPVHMVYEKCENIFMIPGDGTKYSLFEVDIVAEKGRWRFIDHGLEVEVYNVRKEKTYGDYNALNYHHALVPTELNKSLYNYVDNAVNFLDGMQPLLCTGEDAIKMHKVYDHLMRS